MQLHELIKLNINASSNAETIEICRWRLSVVYDITANVAGAIENYQIGPLLQNAIKSGCPIKIWMSNLRRCLFHCIGIIYFTNNELYHFVGYVGKTLYMATGVRVAYSVCAFLYYILVSAVQSCNQFLVSKKCKSFLFCTNTPLCQSFLFYISI